MAPSRLRAVAAVLLGATAAAADVVVDASGLVQSAVQRHDELRVGSSVVDTEDGPMAYTQLGPIMGAHADGFDVFRGVPYAESPKRFQPSEPKQAWGRDPLQAVSFADGCMGSATGVPESEDCLYLNIWVPPGGKKNIPVMVYFHGGINQHGSGREDLRHGDGIVQSKSWPVIWINMDYRLGIFGWLSPLPGTDTVNNLGLIDQQQALQWIQTNIAAFGGDPKRVTLEGQSEGASNILAHMVAPGSASLFQKVVLHSPPADMWSRDANERRTQFSIQRTGCQRLSPERTLQCLKQYSARILLKSDWVAEELSRNVASPTWTYNLMGLGMYMVGKDMLEVAGDLGWHPVVDGNILPGEPRELIAKGRWNKAQVLITVSQNESLGVFPASIAVALDLAFDRLLKKGDLPKIQAAYNATLAAKGQIIKHQYRLKHMMMTDKMWTCDVRSLARAIVLGGGSAYVNWWKHSPKYDPVGHMTNRVCVKGATCHAAEMMYTNPQGRGFGIDAHRFPEEAVHAKNYRDHILAFVSGVNYKHPFVPYNLGGFPVSFYDTHNVTRVNGWRKEQCDVLDSSMGEMLPEFMRKVPEAGAAPMF